MKSSSIYEIGEPEEIEKHKYMVLRRAQGPQREEATGG
jgi:hypothetical protein